MRVVCPSCGAMNSLEALFTDGDARLFMAALTRLPGVVIPMAPRYIALFRPQTGRVLQWRKATRLVDDLYGLIQLGYVHRQGNVDRNCPASVWGKAMEQIVATPPARLPMKNHNYLAAIAWDLADAADKYRERAVDVAQKKATRNPSGLSDLRPVAPMDPETMRKIKLQNLKRKEKQNG